MSYSTVPEERFIPHAAMIFTTGSWSNSYSAGLSSRLKSANAETTTVDVPISLSRRTDIGGIKLNSVQLIYRATTADLSGAITVALHRQEFDLVVAGATGDVVAAAIATTNDGVVTADANDRKLTVTVTSPALDLATETDCTYWLRVTFPCAAGTVLSVSGAIVNYEVLT